MSQFLFLGGIFTEEKRKEIEEKSIGVIQFAADTLQKALINGLDKYFPNLKIINLPYIGSYPKKYKVLRMKTYKFSHAPGAEDINLGFSNLSVYKMFSRYFNIKKYLNSLENLNGGTIIIYSIHTPFIIAAVDLKRKFPNLNICLIVPDLPAFMSTSQNLIYHGLKKIETLILKFYISKIDAFVLLSDNMVNPLGVGSRPWVRMEGIFNFEDDVDEQVKEINKTVLYSGTLSKRYGIMNLLNAFSKIDDKSYRLWICGEGEAKYDLDQRSKIDNRIINFGQIPRKEVLKLQKRATVLVNPRTSAGDFTKYSFPSKTMEYLASGTPCIINRLEGIPNEYYDYCFVPKNETLCELREVIIKVCSKGQAELNDFGTKAKNFIKERKSPEIQCEKIYNMLKSIK